jgi:hypothetical protein
MKCEMPKNAKKNPSKTTKGGGGTAEGAEKAAFFVMSPWAFRRRKIPRVLGCPLLRNAQNPKNATKNKGGNGIKQVS